MGGTKVIKIAKILLGITNNGTPRAYVWQEGSDLNSMVEALDIIGDQVLYVATRHIGEELEVILGKFINVKVPQDFITASSKPTYNRVIGLFQKAIKSIEYISNGGKPCIDIDATKEMVEQNVSTLLELQDTVLDTIKSSKSSVAKNIVENIGKPRSEQTLDPYDVINTMTRQTFNDISKEYKIVG